MRKRVLIYSHVALWEQHHAETIEIALRHHQQGDDVVVLSCFGDLRSCPANKFHDEAACRACRRQSRRTSRAILPDSVKHVRLHLESIGSDRVSPDRISSSSWLRSFSHRGIPAGELVLSQLVSDAKDTHLDFQDAKLRVRAAALCTDAIRLYEAARKLIGEQSIDIVYAFNGRRCSEGPVLYAARDEGAEYWSHEQAERRSIYITVPALKVQDLDSNKALLELLFEDAIARGDLDDILTDADEFYRIHRYDRGEIRNLNLFQTQPERRDSPALKPSEGRKVLVIFTSSEWEFFGISDYLQSRYPYSEVGIFGGINRILSDARITDMYEVIVRWHPNQVSAGDHEKRRIADMVSRHPGVVHYLPDDNVNSYTLLEQADVITTFGSTMAVEATYYGRASVLLGAAYHEDTGTCYTPRTHEELVALLSGDLAPLNVLGAVKYGFYQRNRGRRFEHLDVHEDGHYYRQRTPILASQAPWRRRARRMGLGRMYRSVRRVAAPIARILHRG